MRYVLLLVCGLMAFVPQADAGTSYMQEASMARSCVNGFASGVSIFGTKDAREYKAPRTVSMLRAAVIASCASDAFVASVVSASAGQPNAMDIKEARKFIIKAETKWLDADMRRYAKMREEWNKERGNK